MKEAWSAIRLCACTIYSALHFASSTSIAMQRFFFDFAEPRLPPLQLHSVSVTLLALMLFKIGFISSQTRHRVSSLRYETWSIEKQPRNESLIRRSFDLARFPWRKKIHFKLTRKSINRGEKLRVPLDNEMKVRKVIHSPKILQTQREMKAIVYLSNPAQREHSPVKG